MELEAAPLTFDAGPFGPIEIFGREGEGEWSVSVVGVQLAAIHEPAIVAAGDRGHCFITGVIEEAWPTSWAPDRDDLADGPRHPTLFFLTVGGIPFEVDRAEAAPIEPAIGMWLTVEVRNLTHWG